MRWRWLFAVLWPTFVGCGGNDEDEGSVEIASGNLSGKVAGMSWSLVTAQTDAYLSGADGFTFVFYGEPVPTCSTFGSGNSLLLGAPSRLGEHPFGRYYPNLNGTFVIESDDGPQNLIATQGLLRLDELSTTVRGGLTMTFDSNNSVSGNFEATVCTN